MGALVRANGFDLLDEYRGASFGDERLNRRLQRLAELVGNEPDASFPVAASNDADLEATYRFVNNERVDAGEIMAPHLARSVDRCRAARRVVVAHDTTEFNFGKTGREDLGHVGRGKSFGFYGHFALAIDGHEELRRPLGVLGFEIHSRTGDKGRRGHTALQTDGANESKRWLALIERAQVSLAGCAAIHVMDREADSYALMAALVDAGARFVIRMASDKRALVGTDDKTVGAKLACATVLTSRMVPVSARGRSTLPSYRKAHPERREREAKLSVSAACVTLARPASASRCRHQTLRVNVVRVVELEPPEGETPIEWRLWTTEPVATASEALAVIDAYRCRWTIEEYFKALKTGCAIESRQLETQHGLLNALALFVPIAWRLLMLRTLSREDDKSPATVALTPIQLRCLAGALKKIKRPDLPPTPTVRDAMLGVAGLGGHIKNNGDPGWLVLGRGLDKLLTIELGYHLAMEQM